MNRRDFVFSALALSGCATAPALMSSSATTFEELEPLYRAEAGRRGLTIDVASNGCTAKGDFSFYLERVGDAVALAVGRKQVDACSGAARGLVTLSFTWAELGIARRTKVFLLNPLISRIG
jgi:hypothetical protein